MSGPIVRKYGFPNFEKIFGERDLKHGAEAEGPAAPADAAGPGVGPVRTEPAPATAGEGRPADDPKRP